MTHAEIHARLDELTVAEKIPSLASWRDLAITVSGADIDFMTTEERVERHQLMLMLPTFAEDRDAASARIQARIAERRARHRSKV